MKFITPREAEIINLIAKGYSLEDIASLLFIEKCTIKTHLHRLTKKLGIISVEGKRVFSRIQIVRKATKRGYISTDWIKEILPKGCEIVKS